MAGKRIGFVTVATVVLLMTARSFGGQNPPVTLDVKASGEKTFYVDGRAGNNQVSVFSQSTLEDFTVVCNKVSGKCQIDPKNVASFKGRFSIRVEDLRSGIDLRDTHLRSPEWFDATKYPEVVIEIGKVEDVKKTEPNTVTMKLLGTCFMHGKTGNVSIPATMTYLDETPVTMKRVKGDLLRIRAEFEVKLSDYAITGPPASETIGLKVSDTQAVKVTVFGSTEPPPEQFKPDVGPTSTAPAGPRPLPPPPPPPPPEPAPGTPGKPKPPPRHPEIEGSSNQPAEPQPPKQ
ncbi:MAG TPA: YceI family protein [Phycisphaerae bacterium]|nr:YceI family protein [Phycisphaerae bacterium]